MINSLLMPDNVPPIKVEAEAEDVQMTSNANDVYFVIKEENNVVNSLDEAKEKQEEDFEADEEIEHDEGQLSNDALEVVKQEILCTDEENENSEDDDEEEIESIDAIEIKQEATTVGNGGPELEVLRVESPPALRRTARRSITHHEPLKPVVMPKTKSQPRNKPKTPMRNVDKAKEADSITAVVAKPPGSKRFVCDQCPRSFYKHVCLVEHRYQHTGEKPFTCDECGKQFHIFRQMNEHKQRHSKKPEYICKICTVGFCIKQDYKMHLRHHTNDRRFPCPTCSKAFVRGADLKTHLRVHTGEKPYVCDLCHKCFRANQNLIVHKKSHLGEASKTYQCEQCDKKFMRNIDRKIHMRTHTGEKPFKCQLCERSFSSNANVKAHVERDHGAEEPRARKKPGPKNWKQQVAKQKKLIEELQNQLRQRTKMEPIMVAEDKQQEVLLKKENLKQGEKTMKL